MWTLILLTGAGVLTLMGVGRYCLPEESSERPRAEEVQASEELGNSIEVPPLVNADGGVVDRQPIDPDGRIGEEGQRLGTRRLPLEVQAKLHSLPQLMIRLLSSRVRAWDENDEAPVDIAEIEGRVRVGRGNSSKIGLSIEDPRFEKWKMDSVDTSVPMVTAILKGTSSLVLDVRGYSGLASGVTAWLVNGERDAGLFGTDPVETLELIRRKRVSDIAILDTDRAGKDQGSLEFSGMAGGPYILYCYADGFELARFDIGEFAPDEVKRVTVDLNPAVGVVQGNVLISGTELPAIGSRVAIYRPAEIDDGSAAPLLKRGFNSTDAKRMRTYVDEVSVDERGGFVFSDLPIGRYIVVAELGIFEYVANDQVLVAPGAGTQALRLIVPSGVAMNIYLEGIPSEFISRLQWSVVQYRYRDVFPSTWEMLMPRTTIDVERNGMATLEGVTTGRYRFRLVSRGGKAEFAYGERDLPGFAIDFGVHALNPLQNDNIKLDCVNCGIGKLEVRVLGVNESRQLQVAWWSDRGSGILQRGTQGGYSSLVPTGKLRVSIRDANEEWCYLSSGDIEIQSGVSSSVALDVKVVSGEIIASWLKDDGSLEIVSGRVGIQVDCGDSTTSIQKDIQDGRVAFNLCPGRYKLTHQRAGERRTAELVCDEHGAIPPNIVFRKNL